MHDFKSKNLPQMSLLYLAFQSSVELWYSLVFSNIQRLKAVAKSCNFFSHRQCDSAALPPPKQEMHVNIDTALVKS